MRVQISLPITRERTGDPVGASPAVTGGRRVGTIGIGATGTTVGRAVKGRAEMKVRILPRAKGHAAAMIVEAKRNDRRRRNWN